MKKIDEYIKKCNLVLTDTIKVEDFCTTDFNINNIEVNYENCINLLYLVYTFNKLYLSFKKEYDELEKLNLGKMEVLNFSKFKFDNDYYRSLILYINEANISKHTETFLYLREINNEIKPFITNNRNITDRGYYRENIELNSNISKKYLDLFEKYSALLNAYNYLKNRQVFGDGTNYMFTLIDDYDSNLLDDLNEFKISFGSTYFNTVYFVEIVINLGDNFGINFEKCKLVLDNKELSICEDEYKRILSTIHINRKYTNKN